MTPGPGRFGQVELGRDGEHLELLVDGVSYSSFHPDCPWSGYVWDALAATVLLCRKPDPRVLLLGCGGGTALMLMRRLRPEARLTAVEIDRRVLRLARLRFDLDAQGAEIIEGDGLEYIAQTRRRFDLIIDDMFGAGPQGLARPVTEETAHLRLISRRLLWGGVAVTNSTSDDDPPDLERVVRDAYNDTFPYRLALVPRLGFNVVVAGCVRRLPGVAIRKPCGVSNPDDLEALRCIRVRKG